MIQTNAFVACNVYISAARLNQYPILQELLLETVRHCRSLRSSTQKNTNIAFVQAYADVPYDRSSFHLAGHGPAIAQVVSTLSSNAIDRLLPHFQTKKQDKNDSSTRHPFVGIVDHISILPLSQNENPNPPSIIIAAQTATTIATILKEKGDVVVFTYGSAHPQQHSLAMVRKNRTSFFTSGGLELEKSLLNNPIHTTPLAGVCTIGSPIQFVENVNIRLSSKCTRDMAKSLTKRLRARDGGIPGIEALTLPYSNGRWEVACNLLEPKIGSMTLIEQTCKEWSNEQREMDLIETIYRVGTTEDQCLQALNIELEIDRALLESNVMNRFHSLIHDTL